MTWLFPISKWKGVVPTGNHPGAFGARRKHDIHTGVDLYVPAACLVYAVEPGMVVNIENFTGPDAGSPWWLPTQAVLVEGPSGVVCYGEVTPIGVEIGGIIGKGEFLGHVSPVLPEKRERTDIPGHSRFMLHFELYDHGTRETTWWRYGQPIPENLLDPTKALIEALNGI